MNKKSRFGGLIAMVVVALGVLPLTATAQAPTQDRSNANMCRLQGKTAPPSGMERRQGSLDHILLSSFWPVMTDGGPDSTSLGAPYRNAFLSAIVYDAKGRMYLVVRRDSVDDIKAEFFIVFRSAATGNYLEVVPGLTFSSPMEARREPDKSLKYVSVGGPSSEIVITDKSISWDDGDIFKVKGKLAAPGIQLFLPTRYQDKAGLQTYYNKLFLVEGTLQGEPVKGYITYEHAYDHVRWTESTFAQGNGGLVSFANEYDDGTTEVGFFYCGGPLRGALLVNNKGEEVINTNVFGADNTLNDDGTVKRAVYSFGDGSQWEYQALTGGSVGRMDVPVKDARFFTLGFGTFKRVGEKRRIVRSWACIEAGQTK